MEPVNGRPRRSRFSLGGALTALTRLGWRREAAAEPRAPTVPPTPVTAENAPEVTSPAASDAPMLDTLNNPPPVIPATEDVTTALEGLVLSEFGAQDESRARARGLLANLRAFTGTLPAPLWRDHGRPATETPTLYEYSLRMARSALQKWDQGLFARTREGKRRAFGRKKMPPGAERYAVFVAALLHHLGRVYSVVVRDTESQALWDPFEEPLVTFMARYPNHTVQSVETFEPGHYTALGALFLPRLLSPADRTYLGRAGLRAVAETYGAYAWRRLREHPLLPYVRASHRDVDVGAHLQPGVSEAKPPHSQASMVLQVVRSLASLGEMKVNVPRGPLYVYGDQAALVVPQVINTARHVLSRQSMALPTNMRLYDALRDEGLAIADRAGRTVRHIQVRIGEWTHCVAVVLVPTNRLFTAALRASFPSDASFDVLPAPARTARRPVISRPTSAQPVATTAPAQAAGETGEGNGPGPAVEF